jgi:hypothetical protein
LFLTLAYRKWRQLVLTYIIKVKFKVGRGDRVADGAALEKRWAAMPRGFKSHPLRHLQVIGHDSYLEAERENIIYGVALQQ